MATSFSFLLLLIIVIGAPIPCHLCQKPISYLYNRRVLHQPLYPLPTTTPTIADVTHSPFPSPSSPPSIPTIFPKHPSSTNPTPFFPFYHSSSHSTPSTTKSSSAIPTFPANISSLIFPSSSSKDASKKSPSSTRKLVAAILFPVLSFVLLSSLLSFLLFRRRRRGLILRSTDKSVLSDNHRLFPANLTTSDGRKLSGSAATATATSVSNTSSDFVYLGTVVNSRGTTSVESSDDVMFGVGSPFHKLSSPELRPLPPLSKQSRHVFVNAEGGCSSDDEFYSPRGSAAERESYCLTPGGSRRAFLAPAFEPEKPKPQNSVLTNPFPSSNSTASSPTPPSSPSPHSSPPVISSPEPCKSPNSRSDDCITGKPNINAGYFRPPPPSQPPLPPPPSCPLTPSPSKRGSPLPETNSGYQNHHFNGKPMEFSRNPFLVPPPPPPPPPPPVGYWDSNVQKTMHLPALIPPMPVGVVTSNDCNDDMTRPKLKPLHWDKVRASSDHVMVWDKLRSSSFQLNEEMIETLFVSNSANLTSMEMARRQIPPIQNQENRVLDPKKSQNIAILLRALNVTKDEVCEALLEGNTDSLGNELLETLLKMAPTKEEEIKLREYKDDSPYKLGSAEKFLKALLDIPFAFKRVEAMLYTTNFESEVNYLYKSFETLQVACEELRNSRMFLKLLEAVLKTGNRMNVGTNRGDAQAFKLNTLLKLVHVKGTDGKTTLLHFVVQEIIRAEGSRVSEANQTTGELKAQNVFLFRDDIEHMKHGLQVVSGLSFELNNVKKAAAMDSDVLSSNVSKLAAGIGKVNEVIRLNSSNIGDSGGKFDEALSSFMKKAENEIIRIQAQERVTLGLVKETTEYFHGSSDKEEAHPFRIFMVVRDFINTLDQVCREVGKINGRSILSPACQFPVMSVNNPTQSMVFKPQKVDANEASTSSEDNEDDA